MKKNYVYVISYIALVLLFFLGTLFYRQSFLAILLLLECLLPALSIGIIFFVRDRISFQADCKAAGITSGNSLPVVFRISNPTVFPLLNIEIEFEFYNLFYQDQPVVHSISLSAQPRKETAYTLPFQTCYCGMFQLAIKEVRITDFLHMKSFRLPYRQTISVPILPEEIPFTAGALPQSNEAAEDGDILKKYGVVSTEFQGVREYIPGDRLQHVHWKMSAKADDLLIRNPQPVAERLLTILPEIEKSRLEDTISTFYSFCRSLVREQEIFIIALFSYADKTFQYYTIRTEEELLETLYQLYYTKAYSGSALARAHYASQNFSAEYLSVYGKKIEYYYGEEVLTDL